MTALINLLRHPSAHASSVGASSPVVYLSWIKAGRAICKLRWKNGRYSSVTGQMAACCDCAIGRELGGLRGGQGREHPRAGIPWMVRPFRSFYSGGCVWLGGPSRDQTPNGTGQRRKFLHQVETASELECHFGEPTILAKRKTLDHIDEHARAFIGRSPFIVISTADADGWPDASPRGDPPALLWSKSAYAARARSARQ